MSPFYPPLPDPVPRSGLMAGLGGFAAGQQMQNIALQRQQQQMQMQQEMQMQAALGNYAQTQDPAAFRGVNPKLELELRDKIAKMDPPEVARYGKLADLMERAGPMLTPKGWPSFKQAAVKAGLVEPDELPDTVTPQQLQQMVYAKQILKAELDPRARLAREKFEAIDKPVAAARIQKLGADTALSQERIRQGWAKIAVSREKGKQEKETGPYHQLTKFYKQLHPEAGEPNEDDLHNLFVKFTKSGVNVSETRDMKIMQQAMTNLNKNTNYRDLEPDDPKREQLLDQEINRIKSRSGTGAAGAKAAPAPAVKPLSQLSDEELNRLIAEKQAAGK